MALTRTSGRDIEDIEVDLMLLALRERYGFDFSGYARASLVRRLRQLVEYFSVARLADLLPTILLDANVAQAVINSVSVPTSEFFRDPPVWKFVRDKVIPELDSFPRINVWQIGCGHGQEAWSLAILLHECGLAHKVRMIATDINADLLAMAQRGRWPMQKFDAWRANYVAAGGAARFDDYFQYTGDEVAIRTDLFQPIEFVEHNLVTDDAFLETQFLICRNVLIYFGEALQARALRVFERSLARGGFLLLGSAESIPDSDNRFTPLQPGLRIFRKAISEAACTAW